MERRGLDRIDSQGWNGTECAALRGIAQPAWHSGTVWRGTDGTGAWRADETEFLPAGPVSSGAVVATNPKLPAEWWQTLISSLDVLAAQHSRLVAAPDTVTQDHITDVIQDAFPALIDTTIELWASAHADLNWANAAIFAGADAVALIGSPVEVGVAVDTGLSPVPMIESR